MSNDVSWGISPPGFQLPDESRVGSVRLLVTDLSRSVSYYQQVLGLQLHERASDTAVLGTRETALVVLRTEPGVQPARKGAFGLYHFAILLPERAALGRFAAHVSRAGVRVGMADHLVSEALYLTDPDGLGIEVYVDRPTSDWQHRGRELVMTVDPLDVADLIAAGGEYRWDGVPAGTTIGHVHLHVGSLEDAEAFYHAAVGFKKTLWTYPGALFLAAGGYHHHLGTNTWAPGPSTNDTDARLLAWDLVVPNTETVLDIAGNLRAAGYRADETADGVSATDPWDTGLRVVASAHKSNWSQLRSGGFTCVQHHDAIGGPYFCQPPFPRHSSHLRGASGRSLRHVASRRNRTRINGSRRSVPT